MARAAGQKHSKGKKRRADARGKRVARPGAKPARGAAAKRSAVAKRLARAKRALKLAVAKRVVKRRVTALKRKAAKGASSARKRLKAARKRVTAAAAKAGKRVRRATNVARKRVKRAAASTRKRVTRATSSAKKRLRAAGSAVRKRVSRTVQSAKSALQKRAAARRTHAAPPNPVPPAFAIQRASATLREQLLFELQRARASVKAATQGLLASTAERPLAPGKWSIKEIVLHLSERDRVRLEEFARTLGGQQRSWAGIEDPLMAAQNETHLAPLRAHSWDDALRRLDTLREQLLLRLSEVPAHPDDVWRRGHPFADMMWGLPEHDRHHADQIKLARIGEPVPVED